MFHSEAHYLTGWGGTILIRNETTTGTALRKPCRRLPSDHNPRDLAETVESGDSSGQYELVWLHDNGVGVREDFGKAFNWYLKAVHNAHLGAQLFVRLKYQKIGRKP